MHEVSTVSRPQRDSQALACMVAMPAPVVRLLDSHVYIPYGPRLRVATL